MNDIILDVIDALSAEPLPGATIAINGRNVGMTDSNGVYMLYNPGEFDEITVSYVGYSPYKIAAGILEGSGQIQLARAADNLQTVTVTPSPKKSLAVPLLAVAGLVLMTTDKKTVSGTRSKPNTALIIGLGALGLGAVYLLTRRPTPPQSGLTPQQLIALNAQRSQTAAGSTSAAGWLSLGTSLAGAIKGFFGDTSGTTPAPAIDQPTLTDYSDYIIS